MSNFAAVSTRYEIPASDGADVQEAIIQLVESHGGRIVAADKSILSADLRNIGLRPELNALLTAAAEVEFADGICDRVGYIEWLCGCTEQKLLSLKGVGYGELRMIIRDLAARQLKLSGVGVAFDDLVENLHMPDRTYRLLKLAGYNSIRGSSGLDLVEAQSILGNGYLDLCKALSLVGLHCASLRPDHELREVKALAGYKKLLTDIGVWSMRVSDLTKSELDRRLAQTVDSSNVARMAELITTVLGEYDWRLPD